jgi:hypothetical protein
VLDGDEFMIQKRSFYDLGRGAALALVLLACSSRSVSAAPQLFAVPALGARAPSLHVPAGPRASSGLLFVGADTDIDIFPSHGENQQPIGQITQGLQNSNLWGLAVDREGGLWAALPIARAVTHFPKGASAPDRTLALNTIPRGLAVSADGTLYVAAQPGVLVYGPHDTAPKKTLTIAEPDVVPFYVTVDKSGNVPFARAVRMLLGRPRRQPGLRALARIGRAP